MLTKGGPSGEDTSCAQLLVFTAVGAWFLMCSVPFLLSDVRWLFYIPLLVGHQSSCKKLLSEINIAQNPQSKGLASLSACIVNDQIL